MQAILYSAPQTWGQGAFHSPFAGASAGRTRLSSHLSAELSYIFHLVEIRVAVPDYPSEMLGAHSEDGEILPYAWIGCDLQLFFTSGYSRSD